jgi:hypothetical protein
MWGYGMDSCGWEQGPMEGRYHNGMNFSITWVNASLHELSYVAVCWVRCAAGTAREAYRSALTNSEHTVVYCEVDPIN